MIVVQRASFAADGNIDAQKLEIITTYAPRVWLAKEENYKPSSVEWAFQFLNRVKRDDATYWLETKQALKEPSDNTLPLFAGNLETAPVYSFWIDKSTASQRIVDLAYFFYYPYNRGKEVAKTKMGNHVSDWEHVTVRLTAPAGSEGLAALKPDQIYASAHDFGGAFPWDKVQKIEATHPIVYAAEGSHGCYLEAGTRVYKAIKFIMKLQDECSEGTAWDTFKNVVAFDFNSKSGLGGAAWPTWMSQDYTLPGSGGDPANPASGAIYRWGNAKRGLEVAGESQLNDGPTGPVDKQAVWDPNRFE